MADENANVQLFCLGIIDLLERDLV